MTYFLVMAKYLLLRLCHTFFRLCTGMNWALPVFSADVLLLIVIYFFPFFFSFGITPEARSIWGLIDDHLHKHDSRACRSRFSFKFLEALFYDLTWWWWRWFNFRTRFTTSLNIFLIFFLSWAGTRLFSTSMSVTRYGRTNYCHFPAKFKVHI